MTRRPATLSNPSGAAVERLGARHAGVIPLKQRVQARDELIDAAEASDRALREEALAALRCGDLQLTESAIERGTASVQELIENLRIYQAELRAQAEELAESQARSESALARFASLFSNMPVATLLVDFNGEVLEDNRQARELFLFRPRGLAKRFVHRLVSSNHYQNVVRPAFIEARAVGASACEAVEFVTEGGTRFVGELHISALGGSRDDRPQYVCAVTDRTEHLNDLRALRDLNARLARSESESRLSGLVASNTHNMVVITDAQGRTLWVNPAFVAVSGYRPEEAIGRNPGSLLQGPGTDPDKVRFMREELSAGRGFSNVDILNYNRKGEPYWILLDVQPVRNPQNEITHFIGIQTDITAARRAAESLRVSEAVLADSAGLVNIGGWEFDARAKRLNWSEEARRIHEVGAAFEPHVEAALGFLADPAQAREAWAQALTEGRAFDLDLDLITARGKPLRVRMVGHPEMADGQCIRITGVYQDVTDQHLAQQHIGELTERLNLANDASGIGIWDCDLASDRVYFDARMRELLGLGQSVTGSLREALARAVDTASLARFDAALHAAIGANDTLSVELRLPGHGSGDADDGERFVQFTGRFLPNDTRQRARLIGCAWDCTRDKLAERLLVAKESAESASRAKSAFLSRMSHELRTPLNAIMGFSQLMRLEAEAGDLVVKPHRIRFIETAAAHLLELINEVLDVSRIEAGKMDLNMGAVVVGELVAECLPLVQGPADAAGLSMVDATAMAVPLVVCADRLRLKQVLINLLSNAVKYNRPKGRVTVSASVHNGRGTLLVTDTGLGLSDAQLAGLFEPFNRAGAESTRIEGSGMGLFVSKRFVESMGGTLSVSSKLGTGTVFSIDLPCAARRREDVLWVASTALPQAEPVNPPPRARLQGSPAPVSSI